jgi:hypothetical protein
MIPNNAQLVFYVKNFGRLVLKPEKLYIITPDNPDPDLYPILEERCVQAFERLDGVHITVAECVPERLAEVLDTTPDMIEVVSLDPGGPIDPPAYDEHS